MSQARVTDFFAHRKKGGVDGGARRGKGKTGGRKTSAITKATIPADPTTTIRSLLSAKSFEHEEFIRVIDEATAVDHGGSPGAAFLSPPRTPKRTSVDAEFDLGAALFCDTAEQHSAEKKQRVEAGGGREKDADPRVKAPRRTARKKLILCTPQPSVSAKHVSEAPSPQSTAVQKETKSQVHHTARSSAHSSTQDTTKQAGKQGSKTLSKEEIAALKSRLQKIKKQAEKLPKPASNVSPATHSPSSSSTTASASDSGTTTAPVVVDKTQSSKVLEDAPGLKATLSRAKELVASVQRRKEERVRQESKQSETQAQEGDDLPGYQRYHTLAEPVPPGLTLPYQYKLLADIFRSMDTIVSMLYNRSETATFAKVKQGVQDMTHRRFEESHLGKIKMVFPDAYTFRQEKNIPTFSYNIKKGSYQLTIEPVFQSDQNEARPLLSASRLLERRHIFHQNLVSIVKQHHRTFLSSSVPPLSVPDDLLTRWHPRFNVDTVPVVECSPLPQPPHTDKLSTAQEVLDKARTLMTPMTPKMEKALANMALKTADTRAAEQIPPQTSTLVSPSVTVTPVSTSAATTQTPSALKGVSQSLLERIRAKEAQKLQAAMTRNPVQEQRLLMMSRLPELARILRNVFVAEKKPALIMELACNRMVASYRSALSTGEMEKHLRLLSELAPDWLAVHPIRKDMYLKLTKSMELNVVVDKLNARLKEEEKH